MNVEIGKELLKMIIEEWGVLICWCVVETLSRGQKSPSNVLKRLITNKSRIHAACILFSEYFYNNECLSVVDKSLTLGLS